MGRGIICVTDKACSANDVGFPEPRLVLRGIIIVKPVEQSTAGRVGSLVKELSNPAVNCLLPTHPHPCNRCAGCFILTVKTKIID